MPSNFATNKLVDGPIALEVRTAGRVVSLDLMENSNAAYEFLTYISDFTP
jgi:hypothetical protein